MKKKPIKKPVEFIKPVVRKMVVKNKMEESLENIFTSINILHHNTALIQKDVVEIDEVIKSLSMVTNSMLNLLISKGIFTEKELNADIEEQAAIMNAQTAAVNEKLKNEQINNSFFF